MTRSGSRPAARLRVPSAGFRVYARGNAPKPIIVMRDRLLAFLLPDSCVACGTPLAPERRHLCPRCERDVVARPGRVALPAPHGLPYGHKSAEARYALEFAGAARSLIHALKYGGRTSLAAVLADIAAPAALDACGSGPCAVTAVPLHPVRRRERGFNQSALLAEGLSLALGVPAVTTLKRVRHSDAQAGLARSNRLSLSAADFSCAGRSPLVGRFLLVDDVVTTGATLGAAARALRRAGADEVACFAVAGTPKGTARGPLRTESG